jgi:PAS domain S-box-containing protein
VSKLYQYFIILFLLFFQNFSFSQNHKVEHYSVNDGLASNACNLVRVDNYGYVLIGHPNGGMTRYDGSFNSYYLNDSPIYEVNGIDYQMDGSTWITANENGLAVWFQRKWYYYRDGFGFYENTITKGVYCDDNNQQLVVGVKDSIRIYNIEQRHLLQPKYKSIYVNEIQNINRLDENIATIKTNRGFYLYSNGKLSLIISKTIPSTIIDLDRVSGDRVVVTTKEKIYEAKLKGNEIVDEKVIVQNVNQNFSESVFSRNKVYSLIEDEGFYIYNFDLKQQVHVNSSNGLLYSDVNSISVDKEGYVYLTTKRNGLQIFGCDYVLNFTNIPSLASNGIISIYKAKDETIWVSNANGTITSYANGNVHEYPLNGLIANDIAEYNGKVILATDLGLYQLDGGNFKSNTQLPIAKCNKILVDSKNQLWLAYNDNLGLYCLNNEQIKVYESGKLGLPLHTSILQIRESNDKQIYFGDKKCIYVWTGQSFQTILQFELKDKVLNDFDIDAQKHIWLATKTGLYIYSDNQLKKFNNTYLKDRQEEVYNYTTYLRYSRNKNCIYVGTNLGFHELVLNSMGDVKDNYYYGIEEGLLKGECLVRATNLDVNGNFYFATNGGLYLLPQNHEFPIYFNYGPFLSYLKVHYKDTTKFIAENYYVDRSKRKFHFDFESSEGGGTFSLFFRELTKQWYPSVYYKSRIVPDEKEWIESNNMNLDYNFMSSGLHTLTIIPYERYTGKEMEPIIIELYFKGSWYQSKWFFLLFFSVLAISFFFLLRFFRQYDAKRIYKYNITNNETLLSSTLLIVLVAAVFLPASAFVFKAFVPSLDNLIWLNVLIGGLELIYFIWAKMDRRLASFSQIVLLVSLYIYTIFDMFLFYYTKMHPYYFIGMLLILFASLSILQYIRDIIIYFVTFCIISLLIYFIADTVIYSYNKNLFILGVLFAIVVQIMNLIIKLNTQERLFFANEIVHNSSSLVMSGDSKGNIVFTSDNMESILGYQKEEIMGQAWWEISSKSLQDAINTKAFVLHELKENEPYIRPVKTKSGQFKYIQWVDKKIQNDLVVSVGQDVTERKALEDKFEFLVQNAEDGFFQTDERGQMLFVSNKILEIMGLEKDKIVNHYYTELIRHDFIKKVVTHYIRQIKNKAMGSYIEFPVKRTDGKELWVGQTAKMIYSDDDAFMGFIAVTRDITDKRKVEEVLRQKNKDIQDNMNYAKRMQDALLPSPETFKLFLKNIYLVSQPKDTVGGDFAFIERIKNKLYIAVADCTGHGFTGALMTVLGTNIIRSLLERENRTAPHLILRELDSLIDANFNRGAHTSSNDIIIRDGMEIGMCVYDFDAKTLEYAGAGMNLMVAEGDEIVTINGDFKHIGNLDIPDFKYSYRKIPVDESMNFYLFSDGFQDQFGGPLRKKFSSKRVTSAILEIQHLPFEEQADAVKNIFNDWKGDMRQTDDFIFMGFNFET